MMLKGLRVSRFGFRVKGSVFRVSCFGFWVKGSGVEGVRGGEGVRDKG